MKTDNRPQDTQQPSQSLINQILRYICQNKTDYALMINGPWGCGKTYYVKNALATALSKDVALSYVSLHGIRSFQELDVRMLLGRISWTKCLSNEAKELISVSPTLIGQFPTIIRFGTGFFHDALSWLTTWWHRHFHKRRQPPSLPELIVIDDLERISKELPVEDVLGYIYDHHISKGKHVVFVCDETQSCLSGDLYRKIREKCIRRVYPFPEIDDAVLDSLIASRCDDQNIAKAVQKIRPRIADFMRRHQIKNLRTASTFIDGYSDLVRGVADSKFFDKAGEAIVENLFPLYNEMALGNLSLDQMSNHAGLDNLDAYRHASALRTNKEVSDSNVKQSNYPMEFIKRYDDNLFSQWEFLPEVFRFALTNEFDPEAFKGDFSSVCQDQSDAVRCLNIVKHFELYDEEELLPAVNICLREMDRGQYGYRELSNLAFSLCLIAKHTYLSETGWEQGLQMRMFSAVDCVPKTSSLMGTEDLYNDWLRSPFPEVIGGELHRAVNARIKDNIRRMYSSSRSEAVANLVASLERRKEPTGEYMNGRFLDGLLSDITSFRLQQRIPNLPAFGLQWMRNFIQRKYLDIKSFASPPDETLSAVAEIKKAVQTRLSNKDLSIARQARLTEFSEILDQLSNHLKENSPRTSEAM